MYCFWKEFLLKTIAIWGYRTAYWIASAEVLPEGMKVNNFKSSYEKNAVNIANQGKNNK